ncbi:UDP-glucose 4-epimerase GalE [Ascidiimonas sp. W6]|uniref:UDP-glucose 4-epimerase GalE n=1 Tax=Ascidiimonas meishanensis TaxID=3128903 RepID=UPI0030EB69E6
MKILVTGGLGYIGSHTVVELQEAGFEPVIVDNLSNSSIDVLEGIERITGRKPIFEKIDLRDKKNVNAFFQKHPDLKGAIHFAAFKAVGESVQKPVDYYENNLVSLIYMLQNCTHIVDFSFIFSSSCTVYGQADSLPINEDAAVKTAFSPYGNTKQIGEEIIHDACSVIKTFKAISLRYFNPIGAHQSAEIGELPLGVPQNLVPFITQTASGVREQLSVFGDNYETKDGTCIRDYIDVTDLAKAHVKALSRLIDSKNNTNYEVFNVGTGKGSTVLEVIQSFERISGKKLNYKIVKRREGDVTAAFADTSKANKELGWFAEKSLDEAMASAWKWEQKIRRS